MALSLKTLRQIVTIADCGSFSRAAQELNMSQPALSRSISSLEERYHMLLFERGRAGAVLTPVGEMFVREARHLTAEARSFESNLALWSSGEKGQVVMGVAPLIASVLMPQLFSAFTSCGRAIALTSVLGSPRKLIDDLRRDELEFVICTRLLIEEATDIVVEPVGHVTLGLFVRTDHPLARRGEVTAHELTAFPFAAGTSQDCESEVLKLLGITARQPTIMFDDYYLLKDVMLTTDTIWLSSPAILDTELRQNSVVELKTCGSGLSPIAEIVIIRELRRTLSPSASLLIEMIKSVLASEDHLFVNDDHAPDT